MGDSGYFTQASFRFLRSLARHNDRDWFAAHKATYERDVLEPSLRFVTDFGSVLARFAPRFAAIPKRTGGSLFRIHRDTRFSSDTRPYKTHVGIRFPHRRATRDVHAPVFYLHVEPGGCFMGAGLWHPERDALKAVRDAIVEHPDRWRRVCRRVTLSDDGDRLKTMPRGFDSAHPLREDLKRKSFLAGTSLSRATVCAPDFLRTFAAACGKTVPLVEFLTEAVGLDF